MISQLFCILQKHQCSLVYRKQSNVLSLESVAFNGGRFVASGNVLEPHYHLTDHLGSVRTVVASNGEILERSDYYPFGLRWEDSSSAISGNRYRYNGKEDQLFVNVPYTDFGARMLDNKYRLSWARLDPKGEVGPEKSLYGFCSGNPISRVDKDGRLDDEYYNELGTLIYDSGIGDKTFLIRTDMVNKNVETKLSTQDVIDTEKKISQGDLTGDHMNNVVEIESVTTIGEMYEVIKDDGAGGDSDVNNREYVALSIMQDR